MEEDVIYSEGEPFEGYLYPNNTSWDSDEIQCMKRIIQEDQDGYD